MEVGVRVVRGPDWKWGQQDDGEGHVGTVVEIGKPGSLMTPDKTVVVQWDSGSRTNYRVGYQGSYDLRVIDNATVGVRHPNIICNSCKKHGISGIRWKCLSCSNYDLCTSCYMGDKHDLNHPHARFETANSIGTEMPKRGLKNTVKIQSRGIFVGARVLRGFDWDWGNQDGGEGKVGKVIDIRGWDNESRRSVANVMWSSGSTNVYRLGHKGKVDLKYVADATGGQYYRDHLPILGQTCPQESRVFRTASGAVAMSNMVMESGPSMTSNSQNSSPFNVGDKVKVSVEDENHLKALQEGHGGWNPRMAAFIGQIGVVHRVTERADIRVQFSGCHNRWTFNPESLVRVTSFSIGDIVRVIDDEGTVRDLQRSHGEWIDQMRGALGKMGKVTKVYADGDLRVTVDGQTWTFNPLCINLLPGSTFEMNNTMLNHQHQREDLNPRLGHLLSDHHSDQTSESGTNDDSLHQIQESDQLTPTELESKLISHSITKESIVREAAQGRIDVVKEIVKQYPDSIDYKSSGKTALQVACHQGHLEIVKFLIHDAGLDLKDDEGDTALHYAAFGNQPEIMELLINKGANIDAVNKTKCSGLHISVNKSHVNCVKLLIRSSCNVNLQDSYGDTALHDAIGKVSTGSTPGSSSIPASDAGPSSMPISNETILNQEIIDLLVNTPRIDLSVKNKRGFNCLHQAALKGNNFATERLITKSRQLVDLKKEDGFSALHLAALNGHYNVAETLIVVGQANVNIVNNRKQTPLHLAVSQSHCRIIELLVSMGACTNAMDEDNDTTLHISLCKWDACGGENIQIESSPAICDLLTQLCSINHQKSINIAIAAYLIQEGGADIKIRNRSEKTALDLIEPHAGVNEMNSSSNINQVKEFLMNLIDLRSQIRVQQEQDESQIELKLSKLRIGDVLPLEMLNNFMCKLCCDEIADVLFEPCDHQVVCRQCCVRLKKCVSDGCEQVIGQKIIIHVDTNQILNVIDTRANNIKRDHSCGDLIGGGEKISVMKHDHIKKQTGLPEPLDRAFDPAAERLKYLESKIAEIEEANLCGICMERNRSVVFLCGHGACIVCTETLKVCHMCRKIITKKINMY